MKMLRAFINRNKTSSNHFSADENHDFLRPLHKIAQSWYLNPPSIKNSKGSAWSLRLNVNAILAISGLTNDSIVLYIRYKDDRGQHRVMVDQNQAIQDVSMHFKGTCALPARGPVKDLFLMLKGVSETASIEIEHLTVNRASASNQPIVNKNAANY